MTHDEAFAAMQARKRANEAAAPPRVTWRRVSADTGGGLSGLGPDGILVWIGPARPGTPDDLARGWAFAEFYDFGRLVEGVRVVVGASHSPNEAKKRAATLACLDPVLSPAQTEVLTFLCAGLRASAALLRERGVRDSTLEALHRLDLIRVRRAGARGSIFHLTDLGRAAIRCANESNPEGGPTMNDSILTPAADALSETSAPKRPRGRKDAEQAVAATAPAKPKGVPAEMKALYKTTVTAVKAEAGRGAKTTEKLKYLRIGDAKGKTVAYVNFATSKSVLVEVPRQGATGYDTIAVKAAPDVDLVVAAVKAYVAARAAAAAAKDAATN